MCHNLIIIVVTYDPYLLWEMCEVRMEGSVYQYYANVRTEPVEWLWYPYIPLGKLTVLQGDPGEGKSTFALNVVARITTGQPMPDGVPAKGKRVAIYARPFCRVGIRQ